MTDDWIVHEIKKPIDFSSITPADFEEWARQGLAVPIFQEDVPDDESDIYTEEDEAEEEDEGIIVEED